MPFVGSNGQVYHDNFRNRLAADFQSRVLLSTKLLPLVFNETTCYDFILPSKTYQHHSET